MSYNKQNFVNGQPLTAQQLNYMENGLVQLNAELDNVKTEIPKYIQTGALPDSTIGLNATVEGASNIASGDYSHAEGNYTAASEENSHAEGRNSRASGYSSHAEGSSTQATASSAHAEGSLTQATGAYAHAEGEWTTASEYGSHAEGERTTASGYASHAEGNMTTASGYASHAEGEKTTASGYASHAEGGYLYSDEEGYLEEFIIDDLNTSIISTTAEGIQSHAEGTQTLAYGYSSHSEGYRTVASGDYSHAEGDNTTASGYASHAEGNNTTASGDYSHAEGNNTTASGDYSHAEGDNTTASGYASHAEGENTTASGYASHAEGNNTTASGDQSHAEGQRTTASGKYSHAEGYSSNKAVLADNYDDIYSAWRSSSFSLAKGKSSHVEGRDNLAIGNQSHAEGQYTVASEYASHAEGRNTLASSSDQHVQGRYNIEDTNDTYAHIVGNGSSTTRSNAHTLDWEGNAWFAGAINCEDKTTTLANLGAAPAVYTYPSGVNGIDANTIVNDYHKFVINCANCAYDHGFLDVDKASGEGFSPTDAGPIIQQTMRDWRTGDKAYRTSVDNGATWGEWEYDALKPYPVGSIYMSLDATSPAKLFGGTWERIMDRFLFAAHDATGYHSGATGGEATHTLTHAEVPSTAVTSDMYSMNYRMGHTVSSASGEPGFAPVNGFVSGTSRSHTIFVAGGDGAHNNMPPYLCVYMWKRTA